MVKAKKFVVKKSWVGQVTESHIELVEETLPGLKEGEALFEAVYLSVDPYMRIVGDKMKVGSTVVGQQVAKVVESKNSLFPKGSHVTAKFGWRSHTIASEKEENFEITPLEEEIFSDVPLSLALGILGMPGQTAYLGFEKNANAKPGEILLINAAAGAVGSVLGQLAKIKGLKVIGYAGSDSKCMYLKKLGFDHAFNYKTQDLDKTLDEAAPNGVDIYWDHVGGDFSSTVVVKHMANKGRVIGVGSIGTYNNEQLHKGYTPWTVLLYKSLTLKGFSIYRDFNNQQKQEAVKVLHRYIKEGKMQYQETVTEGFENMPKAFLGLFTGDNIGKAVVKA